MRALVQQLVWLLQYVALRMAETALQCFPIDLNLKTARLAGRLLYRLDRRHRERALENLRASFPRTDERRLQEIARRSCEHLVMVGAEVLCLPRLMQFNRFLDYVDIAGGLDGIRHVAAGRPAILVTGHFGNWELVGFSMAAMGFPPTAIARPLDNPYLNRHILRIRERTGQRIVFKEGMTEEALADMRRGRPVGFIADQDAGRRGFFVDFFGRKASAYKSIAYLALEENIPIFVGGAHRVGTGFKYRVEMVDRIDPAGYPRSVDGALAITARYTAGIERLVRLAPGQYLWVHRRWKTRPPEERKLADCELRIAD
ncbi:MAG: lysophospholipid acyltransferase family protein [Planctomycetes bacterium]|nr:lysophospholipid acyltransferase family protein [Planctomycetota bacterium]